MARRVKCRICKKQLTTDIAYKVVKNNKNYYFCSEKEYQRYITDKKYGEELIKYISEEIFRSQYILTSTLLKKQIKNLNNIGYDNETILKCCENIKDITIYQFDRNRNINTEVQKINYMFAIIKNTINDVKKEENINFINIDFDSLNIANNKKVKRKQKNIIKYFIKE